MVEMFFFISRNVCQATNESSLKLVLLKFSLELFYFEVLIVKIVLDADER